MSAREREHASHEKIFFAFPTTPFLADGCPGHLGVLAQQLLLLRRRGLGNLDPDARPPDRLGRRAPSRPDALAPAGAARHPRAFPATITIFSGPSSVGTSISPPEHERRKRQVELHDDVVAFAREDVVVRDRQDDVEVAGRAAVRARVAFAVEPQPGTRLDAGRDLDRRARFLPRAPALSRGSPRKASR